MSWSPCPPVPCSTVAGPPGLPPLPPENPSPPLPPPGGIPPGIPGFPPKGILADWMGNLCPGDGRVGGSRRSGWRAWKAAPSLLVYMWPMMGLMVLALMVCVAVWTSVIGKSLMWSSTASLVIALAASVCHTLITLGELLCSDGVAGLEGVVFSGISLVSLGLSC